MPLSDRIHRAAATVLAALALLAAAGCDPQRLSELQPGVSTEADVRDRFGAPEMIWEEPGGARTFEYNRQPAGQVNYMITLGPDGKLAGVRQVLTPENFARIQPGMPMSEVRRMLGKPAKNRALCPQGRNRSGLALCLARHLAQAVHRGAWARPARAAHLHG